jgi:hypothetical protein
MGLRLISAKKGENGGQMFGLVVFEVEIQRDERPVAVVTFLEGLFHDRLNALEKVLLHGWLGASGW